jgi:cell division protein FtsI/penicillin-binding protein 2
VPKPFKSSSKRSQPTTWREYQTELRRGSNPRRPGPRLPLRALAGLLLALAAVAGIVSFFRSEGGPLRAVATPGVPPSPAAELADKEDIRRLLDARAFANLTEKNLSLPAAGRTLQVETTLDEGLQNFLLDRIDRENSRHVGIVVMEAATGRVLAMAGFDRFDPAGNPCLRSQYPAASIFKIVTAAAAVDRCGYTADSPVSFSGPKHTLYKRQLTDRVDRYTTTLPLREAFADSINPVFGKLGELRLRKLLLEQSAAAFGFNAPLEFDLPLPASRFQVGDEPYNWAEAASGFNVETTISPLHGAMMASAVVNDGRMVTPSLVERIVDDKGEVLYQRQVEATAHQAMSPRAAAALSRMMEETVSSGTARKAFRNLRRDRVLARLQIGGKTGSIDSAAHDVRYDWFVGFARERAGQGDVVVAAMVGHEKYIGTRAGEYARMAMTWYFGNSKRNELL